MTRMFQGILPIILACASVCLASLEVIYEWKYIDYQWESDAQKTEAVGAGVYNYTQIITHDIQPLLDGRVLVTTPKQYHDNPASLSTVSEETGDGGPLLAPYPDWSWHTKEDCSGITSVSRVFLDDYNRLWFVDSGKIQDEQVCPAKLLAFNATTDELLKEVIMPTDLTHSPDDSSKGYLELNRVQTSGESFEDVSVFMYDLEGHGLVIWDGIDIWRLNYALFTPSYDVYDFYVGSENVIMKHGPVVILLLEAKYFVQDYILFRNLLGDLNYVASLEELLNSKSGAEVQWYGSDLVMTVPEPAKVITKCGGVLFSNFPVSMQYGCWNIGNPLNMTYVGIAETNATTLQYTSSAKTKYSDCETEEVWTTTNRLQKYINKDMDFTEVNFRILATLVSSYVAGTVCAPGNQTATSLVDHLFSPI